MQQIPLTAQKRTVLGRKVKTLRRGGIIPAHIFGHKVPTIHIQVKKSDFAKVYDAAGETGIVELNVVDGLPPETLVKGGQKHPTLVRNVQTHPVTDEPLHIDFYQVNLAEKVKVNVPIEIVGEPPAVEKKIGLLLTPLEEIEIEALPINIPESIQVDVSKLENVGDEIKIKDLAIDKSKIEVQADEELVVAQIGELVTKEMEAVEAEIEAEQAEAVAAEAAPAEGAEVAAAEGEVPAEAPAEGAGAEGAGAVPAEGGGTKAESAAKAEPRPEGREEKKPQESAQKEEKPQEQTKEEK